MTRASISRITSVRSGVYTVWGRAFDSGPYITRNNLARESNADDISCIRNDVTCRLDNVGRRGPLILSRVSPSRLRTRKLRILFLSAQLLRCPSITVSHPARESVFSKRKRGTLDDAFLAESKFTVVIFYAMRVVGFKADSKDAVSFWNRALQIEHQVTVAGCKTDLRVVPPRKIKQRIVSPRERVLPIDAFNVHRIDLLILSLRYQKIIWRRTVHWTPSRDKERWTIQFRN